MWHYRSRVVISIACCLISHSMTFETSSIRFHCSKTVFCDIIADALRFLMSSCALTWEQQCFSDNVQFISDKCVCVCDRLNQNDGGMKERKRKESLPAVRLHDSSGWWSTAQVCVCVCVWNGKLKARLNHTNCSAEGDNTAGGKEDLFDMSIVYLRH